MLSNNIESDKINRIISVNKNENAKYLIIKGRYQI